MWLVRRKVKVAGAKCWVGWLVLFPLVPAGSEYLARTKAEVGGKDWWCLALTPACLQLVCPRGKKQGSGTASRETVGPHSCGETS